MKGVHHIWLTILELKSLHFDLKTIVGYSKFIDIDRALSRA